MNMSGLLPQPPFPWLWSAWQQFSAMLTADRLPHALLLQGPDGIGCGYLATAMAQFLLCVSPQKGQSCGTCKSCRLVIAETHPDLKQVAPEGTSTAIKIDQVRGISDYLAQTAQQGGRKVVVLQGAEKMNLSAANALLKNLEEPRPHTVFILVTERPAYILPTIRSRCSKLTAAIPAHETAVEWLQRNQVTDAENHLMAAGGKPLQVLDWMESGAWEQRDQLAQALEALLLDQKSLVQVAKEVQAHGALWVVDQLLNWIQVALSQPGFAAQTQQKLSTHLLSVTPNNQAETQSFFRLYDHLLAEKRRLLSNANPNPQLLLEEVLMVFKDNLAKTG